MRLFVALDLPGELREAMTGLPGGLSGARWTAPENLHLTLRFIGEVSMPVADEVDHALAALRCRRFTLSLRATGVFHRPRGAVVLWAGVERDEALERLQNKIETALQRVGLPAEKKRFQPHVTLARVDAVPEALVAGWIQRHNLLRLPPTSVEHFTLFSSQPGPDQPVYTAEVEYGLS